MIVKQFTTKFVASIKPPTKAEKQKLIVEKQGQGRSGRSLILHVSYGGAKTWRIGYYKDGTRKRRLPDGSEKVVATRLSASAKLGSWPGMSVAKAREAARTFEPPETAGRASRDTRFASVAEQWLSESVEPRGLRSGKQMRRHIERYVLPSWGARSIHQIDQDDVNDLTGHIAADHGPAMADHVLATLSALMGWWRVRDKRYGRLPPAILRGMRRGTGRARKRVLDDRELKLLWRLTGDGTVFSGLVRTLLLTGQRLETVRQMRWTDIDADGVWTVNVADADRQKGTIGQVRLPELVTATLAALPKVGSPFVFPGVTAPLVDAGLTKQRLAKAMDVAMLAEHGVKMERWTLHDLRRSFRTRLGERCKVDPLTAELTIGHRIKGVAGIYDRGQYVEEKSEALARFATHMLAVTGENVVQLRPVTA